MKRAIRLLMFSALIATNGFGQGLFTFSNVGAPTRLWSVDGSLAGPGIWAQTLAGPDEDSLRPVGVPVEHSGGGAVAGGLVVVPDMPPGVIATVQMVAWDGRIWGTSLAEVPESQLGRTDAIRVGLGYYVVYPVATTRFSQPAVVPIPEPSVWMLGMAGCGILVVAFRIRRGMD